MGNTCKSANYSTLVYKKPERREWASTLIMNAYLLKKEGFSYSKIAKKLRVPKTTVHRWVISVENTLNKTLNNANLQLKEI